MDGNPYKSPEPEEKANAEIGLARPMSDTLVTVGTFTEPLKAVLARNDLQAAGIKSFLVGESFTSTVWYLTNAVGGIRLQVATEDLEQAKAILAPGAQSVVDETDSADESPLVEEDSSDEFLIPTRREENADRAFRGAILGLLLIPLEFYAVWLVLKVLFSAERLSRRSRNRTVWAAVISLPLVLLMLLVLASLKPNGWTIKDVIPILVLLAGIAAVLAAIGDTAGRRTS